MVLDGHAKQLFNGCLDRLNARVTKFDDFSSIGANHVVVLLGTVGFFELSDIFSELMLADKITRKKEFDGVVQCCSRNPVVLVFHLDVERFYVKMSLIIVNLFEYGEPFRGFSVTILFQIGGKNAFYG